jgi:sensory rhodopsin
VDTLVVERFWDDSPRVVETLLQGGVRFRTVEPPQMENTPPVTPRAGDADDWDADAGDGFRDGHPANHSSSEAVLELPPLGLKDLAEACQGASSTLMCTSESPPTCSTCSGDVENPPSACNKEPLQMQNTPRVTPGAGDTDDWDADAGDGPHDGRPAINSSSEAVPELPRLGLKDLAFQGADSTPMCMSERPPTCSTCSGDAENPPSACNEPGLKGLAQARQPPPQGKGKGGGLSLKLALARSGTPYQGAGSTLICKSESPLTRPLWPGDVENPPAVCNDEEVPRREGVKLTWMSESSCQSSGALRDASKAQSEASSATDAASCKPWRLIAARRRIKMKQHHGKTLLHKAAWYAECITCGTFSVACLLMLCLWARHVNEESFVNTFFVTAIAAMTYFAKSCHMGDMAIRGNLVPIARYIDWITTTPLMLYELCHIAHATTPMLIMVIMSDLLMIATGIIAALVPWKTHKGVKQYWFGASCSFYIILLVVLHVDVGYKASKQIEVAANLFKQLEMLTITVWSGYPIIVGIGRAHLGLITKPTEDICLCILDVVAKIGMEGLIVASCYSGCIEEGAH